MNKCINGNDSILAVCVYSDAVSHKLLKLYQKKRERKGEWRSKERGRRGEVKRNGEGKYRMKGKKGKEGKVREGVRGGKREKNGKPLLSLSSDQRGGRTITYLEAETQKNLVLFYLMIFINYKKKPYNIPNAS